MAAGLSCLSQATVGGHPADQLAHRCCDPGLHRWHLNGEGREQAWEKNKSTRTESPRRNQHLRNTSH